MDKRQADGNGDGSAPAPKRGRWDSGPAAAGAPVAAAAPAPAQNPGAAAALAAAVAAKYAQPPSARPAGLVAMPAPGAAAAAAAHLSPGAAAAVAQAAAAALQKLPVAAAGAASAGAMAPGATPAARPASLSLDALEKAKKALQLQKEIQEKLKSRLPQLAAKLPPPASVPPSAAAAATPAAATPATAAAAVPSAVSPAAAAGAGVVPMRPAGVTLAVRPPLPAAALAAAGRLPGGVTPAPGLMSVQAAGIASLLPPAVPEPQPEDERFHDPLLERGAAARRGERRRRAGFDFVQEGRYQREAELFRLKSHLGSAAYRRGAPRVSGPLGGPSRIPLGGTAAGTAAAAMTMDANMVPLGTRQPVAKGGASREGTPGPEAEPPVPAVEWWDRGLLAHASLEQDVPELPAEVLQALSYSVTAPAVRRRGASANGGASGGDVDMAVDGVEGNTSGDVEEMAVDGEDGEKEEEEEEEKKGGLTAAAAAEVVAAERAAAVAVRQAAVSAAAGQLGPFQLKEARLTIYVEHPVPLEPPAEAPPPAPQPLKLTAKELKKLRTQRRLARDKEKQELIRQGLLEPPKPKVRIANLHRVLGTDASLDPTAVEKEVRKQMAERQAAHDDRNLARMLTPAERRDKKLRKLFGSAAVEAGVAEVGAAGKAGRAAAAAAAANAAAAAAAGVDVVCSVYRVGRMTDPQHRFKVDANARENHMTGMVVISDDFCVVVVEGVEKATRRYMKLMMRRIDWSSAPAVAAGAAGAGRGGGGMGDDEDAEEEEEEERPPPNICTLVWQGTVLRRAFPNFRCETVRSTAAGRQLLEDAGVGHYWDAAAAATEGESVPYTL
ncbi:hypothetical protein Agub_g3874 [Astrephomene gubernaculifera]|uniref:Uncharacterized protein n=1 Tax=Astrephomene gubernaculifera TaxID=47775 RepID=A0AAD3DLY7_9CHLO|nr:hypothetical protein Agub_g3874 [Astrephomene gubernaculifera]